MAHSLKQGILGPARGISLKFSPARRGLAAWRGGIRRRAGSGSVPVEVNPLSTQLDTSLLRAPHESPTGWAYAWQRFSKSRTVSAAPHRKKSRMGQQDAALGHHLDQVTETLA
jgi:hypothetical protein